jgi:hypothetical protein
MVDIPASLPEYDCIGLGQQRLGVKHRQDGAGVLNRDRLSTPRSRATSASPVLTPMRTASSRAGWAWCSSAIASSRRLEEIG